MKKTTITCVFFILLFLVACQTQQPPEIGPEAETKVVIYEFYGQGCPHCTKLNNWFEEIKPKYPQLEVVQHEVYRNSTSRKLFQKMAKAYGKSAGGVPSIFIGEKNIVGFSPEVGKTIEAEIMNCIEALCTSPLEKLNALE
jgi:glutaredoxin